VYDELPASNHERVARYRLRDVEMARAGYYHMCYEVMPEFLSARESIAAIR
jgi:hypothetical protein